MFRSILNRPLLCCFTLLLFFGEARSADWPAWRGADGTGVSSEKDLPTHWSATTNVRWKVPLPGAGVSNPVVRGDRIFLTASDGRENERLHVLCFARNDGKLLWHTKLFGSAQPEGYFQPGGMAVPTPVASEKSLYVLFGTGDLACLDLDGKPVWLRSLAQEYGPFRNRWGMAASPVLVGDLLVVLVDHFGQSYLLGVDAKTGANRWKTNRDATVNWSTPFVAKVKDKMELLVAGTYQLRSYDASNGTELWKMEGLHMQCVSSPVVDGDLLYTVSATTRNMLAVRLDGSKGDRTDKALAWKSKRGTAFIPSPVCYKGLCYLSEDQTFGTCLDATTGAEMWRERLNGRYHASPVAGDGKIYFANLEGTVTVIRAGPKFEVLARNKMEESIVASPAISNGQLFIRGEKHLFCIEEKGK